MVMILKYYDQPFSVLKIRIGKSSTPSTSTPSIVDLSVSVIKGVSATGLTLNFKKSTTLPKGKYHDRNGFFTISKIGSGGINKKI